MHGEQQCLPIRQAGAVGVLLFAATFAVAAAPLLAISYVLPTDESMVDRTPTIVFGQIVAAAPAPDDLRLPATDFTVRVEEVLKGDVAGSTVVVRQTGGVRSDGMAMRVGGLRMLREGERVLLFLSERDGVLRTVDFALGIFFEVQTDGRILLEREPSLREDVLGLGQDVGASREALLGPRDGDGFRQWIRDRAAGAERPTDYFVPEDEIVRGPVAVVSAYNLQGAPEGCEHPGTRMRWPAFDRGNSVGMVVQASGQPGVPGGGMTQLLAAMRAWNQNPTSRVQLARSRVSSGEFTLSVTGENSVSFEDPQDQIEGSFDPSSGGTLAVTWGWLDCGPADPPHTIPGSGGSSAYEISESNVTTQDGYSRWLAYRSNPGKAHEEVMAHEIGHVIGIGHSCADEESGPCNALTREAIMRANAHGDGRGAALNRDDRAAVAALYPAPTSQRPPAAPTNVRVTPTNSTTAFVTWSDRSYDEEGFKVWQRLDGEGWETTVRTAANITQAHVYGLRPGGRYTFLVRAWRGNLYSDSDPVYVTMPTASRPGTLQGSQFDVDFNAWPNDSRTTGRTADWSSDKGVLYWLFDSENPEALVKVLDGRSVNGSWWFDLAVTSDLHSVARVSHRATGDEWVAITGLGKDVYTNATEHNANRLVHCAIPASRTDNVCALSGFGTTISLRDAWDSSGRIPSKYFVPSSTSSTTTVRGPAPPFDRTASGSRLVSIPAASAPSADRDALPAQSRVLQPASFLAGKFHTATDLNGATRRQMIRLAPGKPASDLSHTTAETADPENRQGDPLAVGAPTRDTAHPTAETGDDPMVALPLANVAEAASTLQTSQFSVDFRTTADGSAVIGRSANWSSNKGVLFWLFDSENPEALVKVLDGRNTNGHWWFDLAVTSDLRSVTRVMHRGAAQEWVVLTGLGKDIFNEPGETADRLVHCAFPKDRADNYCAFWGFGTTISLRDAWDSSGWIPAAHYE